MNSSFLTDIYSSWSDCRFDAQYLKEVLEHCALEMLADGGSILDIATGDGKMLRALMETFPNARICGLTYNVDAARANALGADIRAGEIRDMPFDDRSIHVVTSALIFDYCIESRKSNIPRVGEPTYTLAELASELARLLADGGLYFTTENPEHFSPEDWAVFGRHFKRLEYNPITALFQRLPR